MPKRRCYQDARRNGRTEAITDGQPENIMSPTNLLLQPRRRHKKYMRLCGVYATMVSGRVRGPAWAPSKMTSDSKNNGQRNLAIGGIAANWGFRPPNIPFQWGDRSPCLTQCYLGLQECPCQMAPHSVIRFSRVYECTTYDEQITSRR